MAVLRHNNPDDVMIRHCMSIRKTLGKDTGRIGTWEIGDYQNGSDFSEGKAHYGVYQVRTISEGRCSIRLKFAQKRPVTYTPAQEVNRLKIKNAVLAWQSLTSLQKQSYNKRAIVKKISGYMLFIKEYMLSC